MMTDFPAVIYLKAKNPSTEVDASEREDNVCESENSSKTFRPHKNSMRSRKRMESYKKLLEALNNVILKKMNKIEGRLDVLSDNSDILEEKVNILSSYFDSSDSDLHGISEQSADASCKTTGNNLTIPFTSKVTQIVLNAEDDFPRGSWLGFENKPEMRVRCRITPKELQQINRKCVTPEKMALTLLDHLFDRETQACSNLSGLGKHKKKQLDPLLIYGIRCHLIHRFDITEEDWCKIKVHMDSKCRTAFRRKLRGMPINPRRVSRTKTSTVTEYSDSVSRDSKSSNSSNISYEQEISYENKKNTLEGLMQIVLSGE